MAKTTLEQTQAKPVIKRRPAPYVQDQSHTHEVLPPNVVESDSDASRKYFLYPNISNSLLTIFFLVDKSYSTESMESACYYCGSPAQYTVNQYVANEFQTDVPPFTEKPRKLEFFENRRCPFGDN